MSPASSPTAWSKAPRRWSITLTGITASDPGITIDAANDSDSIDILDGDGALISIAGTTDGNEAGPVDGVFTVTQGTAAVNDTVLTYTVGGTATAGTDYTALGGTVTITGGSTSATIDVTGIAADSLVEGPETVVITLTGITSSDPGITIDAANNNASIDILDADGATISIAGTTDGNEAGPVDGVFTLTQSTVAVSDTDISYTVAGTATAGTDYTALSGTVTIPAGSTTATIDVTGIVLDSLIEGTETVTVTLTAITASDPGIIIDAANDNDAIDILDGDSATVSIAGTTDGNEAGPVDGVFTVTQTTIAVSDTVLTYSAGGTATAGTDYTALSGTVTIPGGSTSAAIDVTGIVADSLVEGPETVVITLTGITSSDPGITIDAANDNDAIDILDGDGATVSIAPTTDGDETGPVDGVFTLTQSTVAVSDTDISYTVAGTATAGVDYTALSGTVTIPAGSTTATIDVTGIVADSLVEGTETIDDHADRHYRQRSGHHDRCGQRQRHDRHPRRRRGHGQHRRHDRWQREPVRSMACSRDADDRRGQRHGDHVHRRRHGDGGRRLHGTVRHCHDPGRLDHGHDRRHRYRR